MLTGVQPRGLFVLRARGPALLPRSWLDCTYQVPVLPRCDYTHPGPRRKSAEESANPTLWQPLLGVWWMASAVHLPSIASVGQLLGSNILWPSTRRRVSLLDPVFIQFAGSLWVLNKLDLNTLKAAQMNMRSCQFWFVYVC